MKLREKLILLVMFSSFPALTVDSAMRSLPRPVAIRDQSDCKEEIAELKKINDLELPARKGSLEERQLELSEAIEESIALDKKIEGAKRLKVPSLLLDGFMKQSADLRNRIDLLKTEISKREAEKRSLEGRSAALEERIKQGCPPAEDAWQKAIGKWGSSNNSLHFELQDINKADRGHYRNTPIKIEGYVIRQTGWSPAKIKSGDLLFISHNVNGNTITGKWLNAPQGRDCPRLVTKLSDSTIQINGAGDTLTVRHDALQYTYPGCQWSSETRPKTSTYYRIK